MKRQLRYSDPRYWLGPGDASRYISQISTLRRGDKVVLYCRVSYGTKDWPIQLRKQETQLRELCRGLGVVVVGAVSHQWAAIDTLWVEYAARIAKKYGAKLLATRTDRFVRPSHFHPKRCPARASEADLRRLSYGADGVELVTELDPDADETAIGAHRSKSGQRATGRRGGGDNRKGPGWKKRRHQRLMAAAVRLRRDGWSYGQIAKHFGMPRSTVQGWLNRDSG